MGAPTKVDYGCTVIIQRKRDEKVLEYNVSIDKGKKVTVEKK